MPDTGTVIPTEALEHILDFLYEKPWQHSDTSFFDQLTTFLSTELGLRYVFCNTFDDLKRPIHVCSASFCENGAIQDTITYPLKETPCAEVLKHGQAIYLANVQAHFPRDDDLLKLSVQSYLGILTKSTDGHANGLIGIMHDAPISKSNEKKLVRILRVCANIVGSHIELLGTSREILSAKTQITDQRVLIDHLLESIPDALYWKDADLRYRGCNAAFLANSPGDTKTDILGKTDAEIFGDTKDAQSFQKLDQQVRQNLTAINDHIHRSVTDHNQSTYTQIGKAPVLDKDGNFAGIVGIGKNITRHVRFEHLLAEINNIQQAFIDGKRDHDLFRSLLSALLTFTDSDYGLIGEIKHGQDRTPHLQIQACTDITWSKEEQAQHEKNMVKKTISSDEHTLLGSCILSKETIISNDVQNDPRTLGIPGEQPDLHNFMSIPLMQGPQIVGVACIANRAADYSLELLLELAPLLNSTTGIALASRHLKELNINKHELEGILRALDEHAIVSITDKHGHITSVNDKFCQISGYSKEELIGSTHALLKSGEHGSAIYKEMYKTITRGGAWHGDFKNKAKDGSFYWVSSTILPTQDTNGRISGYVSIRTDITREKQALLEQEIEALRKDRFISNISHELRTPLNGIHGFTTLLEDTDLDTDQAELVEHTRICVDTLLRHVDKILTLQKITESHSGRAQLHTAIETALKLHQPEIMEKQLKIDNQLQEGIEIAIAPQTLDQIIENLIQNAVKYNVSGGGISFALTESTEEAIGIAIIDTGIGIPQQYQGKIFERFSRGAQANSPIPGTGLGLAMVKETLEQLGGNISLESDGVSGTSMYIMLPKVQ